MRLCWMLFVVMLLLTPLAATAQLDSATALSADRIKAAVEYLASDRLEGRGPGTRGEILTTDYLAEEFQKAGLKPLGDKGTYLQPVPLVRVVTSPKSTLQIIKGDQTIDIPCEEGFAGRSQTQKELEEIDAEAIFVGHGITAPEFGWDDYKGVDVKGKIVIAFTNEPPSDDPKFFGGTALTYYGRWTYRYEEASRRGAKACFIIHTNETAGYPYSVVQPLDGAQLKRDAKTPALAFAGWLSMASGEKLLALAGRTVEKALQEANTKGFKAYSLGVHLKGNFPTLVQTFVSNNVVGIAEGSDPKLKSEAVVFTAHWDHLGVGRAVLGDTIYNGAADNATGCALLLELARAWNAQSPRPKRSAIFLAVTAEERGLLGSKFYAQNPIVPLGKTTLNLNFDMILPLGVPESIVVTGSERTTAWPVVQAAAKKNGLEIEADKRAHLGIFYRSDHFSIAKAGAPAFSVTAGMKIKGKSPEYALKAYKDFNDLAYHSPQDEPRPDWDYSGFVTIGRFVLDVATSVANADRLITWNAGDEFLPAREKQVLAVQEANWPPEKLKEWEFTGRKVDTYLHTTKKEWGYAAPQRDQFLVLHPKEPRANAPLYVVLHSAGHDVHSCLACTAQVGNHDIYHAPPDFYALYLDCRANQGDWWWGINKYPGPDQSPVDKRVIDCVKWVIEKYGIDPNRVYLAGNSMGGSGTLGIGTRHGDVFAAIKANVPAEVKHVSNRMSFPPLQLPADAKYPDPPIVVDYSAQNDQWSRGHDGFIKAMNDRKYPLILYWGPFGHANNHANILKVNDLINSFDWLSVKKNEPYAVFTNASSNDTWTGQAADKKSGQINAFFRWKAVKESPDSIEMSLSLVKPADLKTSFTIPAEATADVSLRRLQMLRVAPGEMVRWTFGSSKGEVRADDTGLVTMPQLRITGDATHLTVRTAK